jgi:flagellin-specific chaperone FliS
MLTKDLLDKTTAIIQALMLGYELPYEDTVLALDKNLTSIRHTEVVRDDLTIDSWIPMMFDTGIAFYTSIAKRISDEDYKKVCEYVEKHITILE